MMKNINVLAIGVIAVLQMAISAFWYGFFAVPWMEATGVTQAMAEESTSPMPYIIAFVGYLVLNYAIAMLFYLLKVEGISVAIKTVVSLWLAFFFFQEATHYLFALKSWNLILIDTGNSLACFSIAGVILSMWKKK